MRVTQFARGKNECLSSKQDVTILILIIENVKYSVILLIRQKTDALNTTSKVVWFDDSSSPILSLHQDSEVNASEFLEHLEEMFPLYYYVKEKEKKERGCYDYLILFIMIILCKSIYFM